MTDDLVKRLRIIGAWKTPGGPLPSEEMVKPHLTCEEAANRIEELNRAVLDLAQYVSSADLGFYIEPETKKVLSEIGEKKDD
jgi:hypothetical protein